MKHAKKLLNFKLSFSKSPKLQAAELEKLIDAESVERTSITEAFKLETKAAELAAIEAFELSSDIKNQTRSDAVMYIAVFALGSDPAINAPSHRIVKPHTGAHQNAGGFDLVPRKQIPFIYANWSALVGGEMDHADKFYLAELSELTAVDAFTDELKAIKLRAREALDLSDSAKFNAGNMASALTSICSSIRFSNDPEFIAPKMTSNQLWARLQHPDASAEDEKSAYFETHGREHVEPKTFDQKEAIKAAKASEEFGDMDDDEYQLMLNTPDMTHVPAGVKVSMDAGYADFSGGDE